MNIDAINKLVEPIVTAMGYDFVGVEFLPSHISVLRVYIDRKEGVSIDDCQQISQQLNAVLDVEEVITTRYRLEVSSPGEDRLLFTLEQFKQFVGETVVIRLAVPIAERRNLKGKIEAVKENGVLLLSDEGIIEVPFERIQRANLERQYSIK